MENNLSVSFELDENQSINLDDYSSDEFAIARMGFLATCPNSHKLEISEEVLRECAPTVLGKWLVGKYTPAKSDLEGHEPTEQIFGIIPKEQEVEFVEEADYVRAYVNVVVSKFYAKEFCEILKRDGAHSVSVEMSVLTENNRGTNDVVKSFHIIGVTCLGTTVLPSVPESEIEFVRFAEEAESYFDKAHLTAENKEGNKINFEENGKEGESKVTDTETKNLEEIEKVELEVQVEELAEPESKPEQGEDEKQTKMDEPEAKSKEDKPEDKEEDKETEMSADEMKAEMARLQAEIDSRDSEIADNKAKMEAMETELADLREFKKACMEAERASKVETVMSSVASYMDDKMAESYRKKGMECEFEALDAWKNEVQSVAFEAMPQKKQKSEEDITRMSAPVVKTEKTGSVWERL